MQDQLIKSASKLNQPPTSAAEEFSQKQDQLAAKGNQIIAKRPDLDKLVGEGNHEMAEDNNRNFARFMESLFTEFDAEVLVETVLWVFRAYRCHGFQTTYWAANLDIWVEMLRKELTQETFDALYPFYNWLIVNIPLFVKISDKDIKGFCKETVPPH